VDFRLLVAALLSLLPALTMAAVDSLPPVIIMMVAVLLLATILEEADALRPAQITEADATLALLTECDTCWSLCSEER